MLRLCPGLLRRVSETSQHGGEGPIPQPSYLRSDFIGASRSLPLTVRVPYRRGPPRKPIIRQVICAAVAGATGAFAGNPGDLAMVRMQARCPLASLSQSTEQRGLTCGLSVCEPNSNNMTLLNKTHWSNRVMVHPVVDPSPLQSELCSRS